jgi:hypothetical protein
MTEKETDSSNPITASDETTEGAVFGPDEDFFGALEDNVNSAIQDDGATDETPQHSGSEKTTRSNDAEGPEGAVDWEKRYKDSTREAQKLNGELNTLRPFVPVLNAMKSDTGLVEHVRDYLRDGGTAPKNVKERLGLGEDFEFNPHDLEDPDSDSSKLLNAQVDRLVQGRLQQVIGKERQNFQKLQAQGAKKTQETEFKKKYKMSDEQFADMMKQANTRKLTLDDVYYLMNKDQTDTKIARNTKKDMLKQMKNVRNIPASASGSNSASNDKDFEKEVFDIINGSDGDIDNLFS